MRFFGLGDFINEILWFRRRLKADVWFRRLF